MTIKVDIAGWEKEFNGNFNIVVKADKKTIQEACQILFNNIVERTPVGNPNLWDPPYWPKDYTPGTLKAGWRIEESEDVITIYNDVVYAYRVEMGWSTKQAPKGMMRVSVLEFNNIIDKVSAKYKK